MISDNPGSQAPHHNSRAARNGVAGTFANVAKANAGLTIGLVASVAASVVTALLPPMVLGDAVDAIVAGQSVAALAMAYLVCIVAEGAAESAQEWSITVFGQKATHALRSRMTAKLDRLPASYFVNNAAGSTTSRVVNDVDAVEALFASGVVGMAGDVCQVVGIVVVVWTKGAGLGLLLVASLPAVFAFTRHVQRSTLAAQTEVRAAVARSNAQIPETLRTLTVIRGLGRQAFMRNRYARSVDQAFEAQERSNFYDSVYSPVVITISAIVIALALSLAAQGGSLADLFGVTVGGAVAVIAYVQKVFSPISDIGMEIQSIQQAEAGVRRINELLAEPEQNSAWEMPNACGKPSVSSHSQTEAAPVVACLDHVTFGYRKDAPILQDFSLQVRRGEHVCLAGRTGSGKSTVLRLLLGLYEPDSGSVTLLGKKAGTIPPEERRRMYGYVEQGFRAIPGSVLDQVTLGDDRISREQALNALSIVGLNEAAKALPSGMDTPIQNASFSQGQYQLLGIARAIASNPQLLILDEVTANLDSATQEQVVRAIDAAGRDRTTISVSHRLFEEKGARIVRIDRT